MRRADTNTPGSGHRDERQEEQARPDPRRTAVRTARDSLLPLFAELEDLYRDADAAFAGWGCPASTECCRFGITGREPYVTSIELAAVRRAMAALGGPRAWKRASPMPGEASGAPHAAPTSQAGRSARRSLPVAADERTCPLLTDAGRCAIYASRPLGCRTFYCDRALPGGAVKHRDITALVRRIQAIGARHEPGGDQGRPLTRALADLVEQPAGRKRRKGP